MSLILRRGEAMKLRFLSTALICIGALLSGYFLVSFAVDRYSANTNSQSLAEEFTTPMTVPEKPQPTASEQQAIPPYQGNTGIGEIMGVLLVPRFGNDYAQPIIHGVEQEQLSQGIGHMPETALPGQMGNVYLAGHRVTHSQPLYNIDTLEQGDLLTVITVQTIYYYTVYQTRIVDPVDDAQDVTAPVPGLPDAEPNGRYLTLQACHPKYSAKQRYIVHAELSSFEAVANTQEKEYIYAVARTGL